MHNKFSEFLGKRLYNRRRLLNLTQTQLAAKLGLRFQQIQKYEAGVNKVSAFRLWQLAEALDVPVGYFFDGFVQEQGSAPPRLEAA